MKYIDLHVHSNASDGTLTPTEVVELAVTNHISVIALTDHDTLAGILEAQSAALSATQKGHIIQVIPGAELSVSYGKKDIHILGLFVDPNNELLLQSLATARQKRDERNEKMAANLAAAGFDISIDKIRAVEGDAVLTRAHFAKYLVEHGYVKNNQDAFNRYLSSDSSYYVPREYLDPGEAIHLIQSAGGLAILAHPLLYKYSLAEVEQLVSVLTNQGLDGIEAIYSANIGFDEGHMRHLANKYGLVISGGSDFHGANKTGLDLGIGRGNLKIPYLVLEKLEERIKMKDTLSI